MKIFSPTQLLREIQIHAESWEIRSSFDERKFIDFMLQDLSLKEVILKSAVYADVDRYSWGTPSPYELALSIRPGSYLSHATAVFLNQLTNQIPSMLYANKEQGKKGGGGSLSQAAIDKAFAAPQRRSTNVFRSAGTRITALNGKFTGQAGVIAGTGPAGEPIALTSLERTLIDIVVRPTYAGGIFQVLEAYKAAISRIDISTMIALLGALSFVYPYHQAIGFLLQMAGYPASALDSLRQRGLNFDFYLAHGIVEKRYVREWRLFVPKDM
jgi:hypothetical protein